MNRPIFAGASLALVLLCATQTRAGFYQADPAGYKDDLNLYAYVHDDPTNLTDPMGRYVCSGNKSDCATVGAFVKGINKALSNLDPNSDAYKKVSAVASYLGKAGDDNGVTVNPTALKGNTLASAGSNGVVNVDIARVSKVSTSFAAANQNMSGTDLRNATGAGVLAHEVRHERDFQRLWQGQAPPNKAAEMRTELNAYGTQAGVWQGLGLNTGLWSSTMTPAQQIQAIQNGAASSTNVYCMSGGSCP